MPMRWAEGLVVTGGLTGHPFLILSDRLAFATLGYAGQHNSQLLAFLERELTTVNHRRRFVLILDLQLLRRLPPFLAATSVQDVHADLRVIRVRDRGRD